MKVMRCFLASLAVASMLPGQTPAPTPPSPVSLNEFSSSLESLVGRVRPSVVQIYSTGYATGEESGDSTTASLLSKQHSTGSGIVLSEDGYIVTNAHVVKGARRIQVRLPSASEVAGRNVTMQPEGKLIEAKLVGLDRDIDIAVVKIDRKGLPFLTFGDSSRFHNG
jgi:serine protease Do